MKGRISDGMEQLTANRSLYLKSRECELIHGSVQERGESECSGGKWHAAVRLTARLIGIAIGRTGHVRFFSVTGSE